MGSMNRDAETDASRIQRIRADITKAQESFSEKTIKSFRGHLHDFASNHKISLSADQVRENCKEFLPQIKACQFEYYVSKLVASRKDICRAMRARGKASPGAVLSQKITHAFTHRLAKMFHSFVSASVPGLTAPAEDGLEALIETFRQDAYQRSMQHTAKILELFALSAGVECVTEKTEPAGESSETETQRAPVPEELTEQELLQEESVLTCNPKILDIFGRGLLYPLDLYFQVCDPDQNPSIPKKPTFPRSFCGPVLFVAKSYLIGTDKYRHANAQFVKYVSQAAGTEDFTREDCAQMFDEPRIKLFLMGYLLNNLRVFMDEIKQEKFIDNVNTALVQLNGPQSERFEEKHFSIMTNAWARFIFDNFEELKAKKTGKAVLKHYIPALSQQLKIRESRPRA
ncbi:MAG: hypothetical protein PWQ57_3090 [Desulfovibrionales bacterium]|jgi:hypothetical protein|nr:hypothetical protein [Desulfovibrionales bacterium]